MGLFIGLKDKKEIDAAYFNLAKEIQEDVQREIDRLRKRFERFKEIEFDEIEDVIEEETKEMNATDFLGPMDIFYVGDYININDKRMAYDKAKKTHYDEVVEKYNKRAEKEKYDYIYRNTHYRGPEQFFMAKKMTPEEIEEFLTLLYASKLEDRLSYARTVSAIQVTREKHKLSRNLGDQYLKDGLLVRKDIEEVRKMGEIGTIERIQLLDERQKRKKEEIKYSIRKVNAPDMAFGYAGGYIGVLISRLLNQFTGAPDNFGYIGGYIVGHAAGYALLHCIGKNFYTDVAKIQEAKDLGIYDAMVKAEEVEAKYNAYKRKMMEKYSIEEEAEAAKEAAKEQERKKG